jgi:cation diffusion facilitator CzcD-associated flavoprotein CzcO
MPAVTGKYGVIIIGSGFGGIGMAIALKKAGFSDFVILEKDADLGGTWRDNQYPGCACDVPSPMYSFSFELNPSWSRLFAPQPEIWSYLRRCAAKYGVDAHIRYGCEIAGLDWDDAGDGWQVRTSTGSTLSARAVVSGAGGLHIPARPDIPGADLFSGVAFHSARWDQSCDLVGKQVAVIGTGASAIQFIPEIAEKAASLTVFQRTPPWVLPRPDTEIPERTRQRLATVPFAARGLRDGIYWLMEARGLGFAVDPRLQAPAAKMALRHLERQVADPVLRAQLTPDYTIGCKRILLSSTYYPALQLPHVQLVTGGVASIDPGGVRDAGGTLHPADVLIYGTGFRVVDAASTLNITGRDGRKLADAWQDGVEAYRGITVPGFPNLFLLLGPNTGLGHNSVVFMIESQVQHIMSCLRLIARERAATIEVSAAASRAYNDSLQRRLQRKVWSAGGCNSWYLDDAGVNRAIWPGFSFEYWARTRHARRRDYHLAGLS